MGIKLCSLAAVVLALGVTQNGSSGQPRSSGLLSKRVLEFEFHGASDDRGHVWRGAPGEMVQAILALAVHTETPIAVEGLTPDQPTLPIEIKLASPATVGEILDLMIEKDARYQYREEEGIIVVRPWAALGDKEDCLNTVVPRFRTSYPWEYAWHSVECLLGILEKSPERVVPDPAAGCGGGVGTLPCHTDELIELDLSDARLLEIANKVAVQGGNFAWSATYEDATTGCGSLRLGHYQPATCYPYGEQEQGKAEDWIWVKGLPPSCRGCHYHWKATQ